MALVPYDSSSSDKSEEEKTNGKVIIHGSFKSTLKTSTSLENLPESSALANLLNNLLPTPKAEDPNHVQENKNEFPKKKEQSVDTSKKVVQIDVTSLTDLDKEDDKVEPTRKKTKMTSQASELFEAEPPENWNYSIIQPKFISCESLFLPAPSGNLPYYGMSNEEFEKMVGIKSRVKENIDETDTDKNDN